MKKTLALQVFLCYDTRVRCENSARYALMREVADL